MTAAELINRAVAAFSGGRLAEAQRDGEAALRIDPRSPAALQLLGVVLCQRGDLAAGAARFREALRLQDSGDIRLNLARALLELGEYEEAEALCRPDNSVASSREMRRMRADVLKAQGRQFEAIPIYEQLTSDQADDFESWNNLGNARHEAGDLDGALEALHRARACNPQSSVVHTNIGRVLISKDRYEEACLFLEKAALLAPTETAPLLELGRTLTSIDHAVAGLRALGAAARLDPRDPRIFSTMGVAFTDLADLEKAEKAYRIALDVDASYPSAYLNLGILLEKANRVEELDSIIKRAAAAGINGDELNYLRALSLSRHGAIAEAYDLVRSVRSKAIHAAKAAHFKGQLADRLNQTDEAFAAFEEMNQAAAESPLGVGLDRSAYQRAIEGISSQTTADWFGSWRDLEVPVERQSPIFLVGFPRSGTTLLDTVLMGHEATHVLEELPILEKVAQKLGDMRRINDLNAAEIVELRNLYFAELGNASPPPAGKRVIDKNPLSMIRIPLIYRLFPDAKIIFTLRHPCDVVLSCFMQNFKVTEAMASFLDLQNASKTYSSILSYWTKCESIFPIDVHTVRYEAMVADLRSEVEPLLKFLDLPWDDSILDHQRTAHERGYIRTPSYAQVTERIYDRASGRWNRYRKYMEPILPVLAPWAERFGYNLD